MNIQTMPDGYWLVPGPLPVAVNGCMSIRVPAPTLKDHIYVKIYDGEPYISIGLAREADPSKAALWDAYEKVGEAAYFMLSKVTFDPDLLNQDPLE